MAHSNEIVTDHRVNRSFNWRRLAALKMQELSLTYLTKPDVRDLCRMLLFWWTAMCPKWTNVKDTQTSVNFDKQESCVIAKMTAQCALHMGALKNIGTPWLRPRLLFRTFLWAFVPTDPMNVPTKFEVRSFTRSWDNRGYTKNGQSLDTPTLHFLQNF